MVIGFSLYVRKETQAVVRINWTFVLLGSILLVAVGLMVWSFQDRSISASELESMGVVILPEPINLNELSLVDENGVPFGKEHLKGKWSLGFFGYTHCPDICPITLGQLKTVFEDLENQQDHQSLENVQRLFISVDSERDNPQQVKTYTDSIDPDIIGITGDPEEIKHFSESVYVGYRKLGERENQDDYLVEHQGNLIIFNRSGDCYGFIKSPFEDQYLKRIIKGLAGLD